MSMSMSLYCADKTVGVITSQGMQVVTYIPLAQFPIWTPVPTTCIIVNCKHGHALLITANHVKKQRPSDALLWSMTKSGISIGQALGLPLHRKLQVRFQKNFCNLYFAYQIPFHSVWDGFLPGALPLLYLLVHIVSCTRLLPARTSNLKLTN